MDVKEKVLLSLKTKAKALGFTKKELESAAAAVADNLHLADDATDEDADAAVITAVEAALPILKLSQSAASRAIQAYKVAHGEEETVGDGEEPSKKPNAPTPATPHKEDDEMMKLLKAMADKVDRLGDKVTAIEGTKVAETRRSRLEAVLKDTGIFGKRELRSFDKMKFDTDDEFDEYISQVEEDLKAANQERADAGLSKLGTPPASGSHEREPNEPQVVDDAMLDSIASA